MYEPRPYGTGAVGKLFLFLCSGTVLVSLNHFFKKSRQKIVTVIVQTIVGVCICMQILYIYVLCPVFNAFCVLSNKLFTKRKENGHRKKPFLGPPRYTSPINYVSLFKDAKIGEPCGIYCPPWRINSPSFISVWKVFFVTGKKWRNPLVFRRSPA